MITTFEVSLVVEYDENSGTPMNLRKVHQILEQSGLKVFPPTMPGTKLTIHIKD